LEERTSLEEVVDKADVIESVAAVFKLVTWAGYSCSEKRKIGQVTIIIHAHYME